MNPVGNERLTAAVGTLLILPVLVEIATVLLGVHTFMSVHVFVGLALIPAVTLKLATTGWRFVRYYTRSRAYVEQGPPQIAMRVLAPLFVAATVVLFASGVVMGFLHGHSLQIARSLHGPASVVWLVLLGLHVLVYLGRAVRDTARLRLPARGSTLRVGAVAAAVSCGVLLAVALVPAQHRWVDIRHDYHDRKEGSVGRAERAVLDDAEPAPAVLDHGQRPAERGRLDAAHRASVGDHEDASTVRMTFGYPP